MKLLSYSMKMPEEAILSSTMTLIPRKSPIIIILWIYENNYKLFQPLSHAPKIICQCQAACHHLLPWLRIHPWLPKSSEQYSKISEAISNREQKPATNSEQSDVVAWFTARISKQRPRVLQSDDVHSQASCWQLAQESGEGIHWLSTPTKAARVCKDDGAGVGSRCWIQARRKLWTMTAENSSLSAATPAETDDDID